MKYDLYVYYRVKIKNSYQLSRAVKEMQAELSLSYRVSASIKRRFSEENSYHTWMEAYSSVTLEFSEIVEKKFAEYKLSLLISGSRQIEFFMNPC